MALLIDTVQLNDEVIADLVELSPGHVHVRIRAVNPVVYFRGRGGFDLTLRELDTIQTMVHRNSKE